MSALPPYSTFRTDNKVMYPQATSHGNVLSFTPPGFNQVLNVKFPDSRLAVCEKCKKNYKTRDMCRVRNSHTEEPWSTAFICITLDMTCTDSAGTKYVDKPFQVRMNPWQPYCVKQPFDAKTPVCAGCKKTNRTRSFCRERHQHRQLPWCTVYVTLTAVDNNTQCPPAPVLAPVITVEPPAASSIVATGIAHSVQVKSEQAVPATVGAPIYGNGEGAAITHADNNVISGSQAQAAEAENKDLSNIDVVTEAINGDVMLANEGQAEAVLKQEQLSMEPKTEGEMHNNNFIALVAEETPLKHEAILTQSVGELSSAVPQSNPEVKNSLEGDNIHKIEPSRTFLAKVSCRGVTIHWLELAEMDSTTAAGFYHQSDGVHSAINAAMRTHHPGIVPSQMTHMDPATAQYYPSMNYAAAQQHQHQHQNAFKMQQHHFLMHQRQQQQQFAAWQAYNQQMHMVQQQQQAGPHNAQQGKAPGASASPTGDDSAQANVPQGSAVPQAVGNEVAPNQLPAHAPQPGTPLHAHVPPHQQNMQPQTPGSYLPPPPNMPQQQTSITPTQPTNPSTETPTTPAISATVAAQHQAHWQAHMMYHQQFYQQPFQMQQQQIAAAAGGARAIPQQHMMQHPMMMSQPQHAGMQAQPGAPPPHPQGQAMMMTNPTQPQMMQGQQAQSLPQQPSHNGPMMAQQQMLQSSPAIKPDMSPLENNVSQQDRSQLLEQLSDDQKKENGGNMEEQQIDLKRQLDHQLEEVDKDIDSKRQKTELLH